MLKKLTSMATAALLIAAGLSITSVGPASATGNTDANLTGLSYYTGGGSPTSVPNFAQNTTSYTVEINGTNPIKILSTLSNSPATKVRNCNGTVLATDNDDCLLVSGANTYTLTVTATDGVTTKTYTITFNYTPPAAPVLTSSSTISAGNANPTLVISSTTFLMSNTASDYTFDFGTTGLTVSSLSGRFSQTLTIQLSGTASAGTLTFQIPTGSRPASNTLSFVITGGSSSAPSQDAGALAAAASAREAQKQSARAEITSVLKNAGTLTLDSFVKADIPGVTPENIADVQAEILALPEESRTDINQVLKVVRKYEIVGKIALPLS